MDQLRPIDLCTLAMHILNKMSLVRKKRLKQLLVNKMTMKIRVITKMIGVVTMDAVI